MSGIEIKNLTVAYGEKTVFDGFNAHFAANKISVVLGGSGVGKTTLLNAVAGLIKYNGSIDGAEDGTSYIFQKDRLLPMISVYKNLDLVLKAVCKDKNERRQRIENMLEMLGVEQHMRKLPTQLSGGEAQRVAMARAFLYPSDILLLDEPFKALDTALKSRLLCEFSDIVEKQHRTVIFVTHAIDECLLAADDYYVLSQQSESGAGIALSGSIDIPKRERKLSDEALINVRAELLASLENSSDSIAYNDMENVSNTSAQN